jgi:predicted DNA-binding transcriptional regulator AlpA
VAGVAAVRVPVAGGPVTVVGESDPLLSGRQVAARVGVAPSSWRSLVSRGLAPVADVPDDDRPAHSRFPRWRRSTVDRWAASRPGQGFRSDLLGEGKS